MKYIIQGTDGQRVACYHCDVESEEEALSQWENNFSDEDKEGLYVSTYLVEDSPFALFWRKDGYKFLG